MIIDANIGPSIRDTFVVDRSIFLNQLTQSTISTKENQNISGHSASVELKSTFKPAVGEFIERHSLHYNNKKKEDLMPAFRLLTGEMIQFPAQDIVFINGANFNDSCGVASHLHSKEAIETAFLEFFERQSFIFNWLTHSEGYKISDHYIISDDQTNIIYKTLHSFFDDVYLFEISLHPHIHVVLALGIGEYYKGIGLSASYDLQESIYSSLKEMLQSISNNYNKQEVTDYEENDVFDEMDIYTQAFIHLSPQQFLEKFNYLFKDNNQTEFEIQDIEKKTKDINSVIKIIEQDLDIQLFCCFIPTFYNNYSTKIVKVFSKGGYPHMDPSQYDEKTTRITFNKEVDEFPNAYKRTPFP